MRQKSIKTQLLLAFILIAVLPIAIISQFIYNTVYDEQIAEVIANLDKIADKKVEQINNYSQERLTDVRLLAVSPRISDDIERLTSVFYQQGISSAAYHQLAKNIRDTYQNMISIGGYYDVFLISKNGDIVFSIKHEADLGTNLRSGAFKDSELARVFNTSSRLSSSVFSSYRYYLPSNADAAFVAAPILNNRKVAGIVALQINSRSFQQVIQDNTSLGNTGETLVARVDGQQGYFLFPPEYSSPYIRNNRVDLNAKVELPILHALNRENSAI